MSIMTTFSLLISLAGCNDAGVTAFNASPEAAITSHVDGAEVFEGMTVTFRGSASDPDDATATLTTTWYLGTAEACPATLADATGVTSCDIAIGIDDTEVTLEVTDPGAASGSASITLTVVPTDSPDAEIVTPEASGVYYSDQKITFEGVVSDGEDAAEDLIAYWESDIDGLLKDVEAVPNAEGEVLDSGYLTEGEHFLVLSAEDTTGKTGSDSVTITVGPPNSGPTCSITAPDDNSAGPEGELVIFEGLVDDVDVPADWLSVAWSSDKDGDLGESAPDSEGKVAFPFSDLSVETHVVTMTTTDEIGATCTSFIIYTVGEPPEVEITLPTDGAVLQQGDAVTFEAIVSDNEDQPDDLTLEWSSNVDGVLSTDSANSSGSAGFTTVTLSPGLHEVTLSALDTDGLDNDDSILITINEAPVIDSIDITPATGVTTTTTLTCTATGTDPEDGALTPALTWSNAANLSWIPTGSSVTLTAADASPGDEIACTATITDSDGAIASASTSVFVENSAPSISSVTITPNPAVAGDSLTCSYSGFSDVDGDADASTLEWFVNGASEGTTSTLTSTLVQGDSVMCTVTPTDGTDSGTPLSDSLTISNTAPVLADVSLGPDPAYEDDTLTCTAGSATDVDGSAVTFTYAWAVNGGTIAATSETLTGADFNKNDDVYCTVTPNDGTDSGAAVDSNTVTIQNTAPTISSVTIDPNPATATDTLTCSWTGFSDADGDSDASTINWTINGVDSGITSTVLMSGFVGGDSVTCTVTAFDGTDDGTVLSDTVVIDNTAPVLADVLLEPTPAYEDTTLTCTPGSATDSDGAAITFNYAWTVNSVGIAATSTTLTGADFDKNDDVFCTVTPTDGSDSGAAIDSGTVTIQNTPPEAPVISIIPAAPIAGEDDLVCNVDVASYDVDGDSVTYSFDWEVDGVSYGGMPTTTTMSSTIAGTDTNAGETWTCTVTPNDGDDAGATSSTSVVIEEPAAEECWSLEFDGVDDYIEIPDHADWSFPGDFTIEASYRLATVDFAGSYHQLLGQSDGPGIQPKWMVDYAIDASGTEHFLVFDVDGYHILTSPITQVAGQWTHLAVVRDGIEMRLYVDGILADSANYEGSIEGASQPLTIGIAESTMYFEGNFSSVRISDTARYVGTDFEVDTDFGNDANTLALWRFNQGSGTTAYDSSANGHHGTIDGATWVEYCPDAPDYTSPSTDYGMNYIPPGTFERGCTAEMEPCDSDEYPVHDVTITNGFYIGITEVTQAQWEAVMGSNPSYFTACGDDCPVEQVSWVDAVDFANELSALDGFTPVYSVDGSGEYVFDVSADGYRLPTEAEWEYAARANEGTTYAGSNSIEDVGWYVGNSSSTMQAVAGLAPNGFGLHDMSGNAWEWTWDMYDSSYYAASPGTDPTGALSGADRVYRGGCWNDPAANLRVSGRHENDPGFRDNSLGLRLVRTVHTDEDSSEFLWTSVSAGQYHNCGVTLDGTVECWGRDNYGQSSPPGGVFEFVSAGGYHTCGVKTDGSIECWGVYEFGDYGQSSPPGGFFESVSAGWWHTCGVKADGSVECWGRDNYGQSTSPGAIFDSVSAGGSHNCGVLIDGNIQCWGNDWFVQSAPPSGSFESVSGGEWHTCGIRTDGTVECWGLNTSGQSSPPGGSFESVNAGSKHTCGVKSDGTVECWGRDFEGESTPPSGIFESVSADENYTCGVRSDGSVECWGSDIWGQSSPP